MKPKEEQGILFMIWKIVFDALFISLMDNFDGSIFFGGINNKNYDTCNGRCDASKSRPIDLWYIRTFVTILFPPFGVFLARGINGFMYIIICCILTCFFYFPRLIYAFAVMNVSQAAVDEQKKLEEQNTNVIPKNVKDSIKC